MPSKIIAFAGRSHAGKDSCAAMLIASIISSITVGSDESNLEYLAEVKLSDEGKILVKTDNSPMDDGFGELYLENRTADFISFMSDFVYPFVKKIPLAESLKEMAVDTFGLNWHDLHNQEGKEKLTEYSWKNLPTKTPKGVSPDTLVTNRQFLQSHGEYWRGKTPLIWEKNWLRKVESSGSELVVVSDVRHPESVEFIQDLGGKVIYLNRNVTNDSDSSENAFKDLTIFDYVVENQDLSMEETHKLVFAKAVEYGMIEAE